MNATEYVKLACRQIGGLNPHPDVTEAEWSQWLQGFGGVTPARHCPECGDRLVEKHGTYGTFWGCASYPDCRHTENG